MGKKRRKKQDNRGLTLLEVIIAVAIFSIAAVILMQGFVTSGRINKKSNLYLEATSTAQNVMEEMKAKSFEKIALAFNYPVDPTYSEGGFCRFHFLEEDAGKINQPDGVTIQEKIYDGAGNYIHVKNMDTGGKEGDPLSAAVLSEDGGKTYLFNPRKAGNYAAQYFFELLNVTNKKERFDVRVTFDGGKNSDYRKKSAFEEDKKNDYEAPNIAKLDNKTNGFLIMNKVWDDTALKTMVSAQLDAADAKWHEDEKKWNEEHPPTKDENGEITEEAPPFPIPKPERLDETEVYKNMRRTLVITLYENNGITTAKAHYKLCAWDYDIRTERTPYATFQLCPCGGLGKISETAVPNCFCTHNSVDSVFYSSEAEVDLKNLYLFYYPNYASDNRMDPLDTIAFINEANYPVDFYVVKQNTTDITSPVELSNLERGYRMNLEVTEDPSAYHFGNWITNPGLFKAKTKLCTNLDFDISEEVVTKRQKVRQKNLTFQDVSGTQVRDITAEKILSCNGLDDRQQKDSIYKVSVEVYRQGAAENGFPEKDLIVSLDGSKED